MLTPFRKLIRSTSHLVVLLLNIRRFPPSGMLHFHLRYIPFLCPLCILKYSSSRQCRLSSTVTLGLPNLTLALYVDFSGRKISGFYAAHIAVPYHLGTRIKLRRHPPQLFATDSHSPVPPSATYAGDHLHPTGLPNKCNWLASVLMQ